VPAAHSRSASRCPVRAGRSPAAAVAMGRAALRAQACATGRASARRPNAQACERGARAVDRPVRGDEAALQRCCNVRRATRQQHAWGMRCTAPDAVMRLNGCELR
jgi:hypothetical protein